MKKIPTSLVLILITITIFAQPKDNVKCRIWKPASFCDFPEPINFPERIMVISGIQQTAPCELIDKTNNLVGIWVTFPKGEVSKLNLTNGFKNIKLVGKNLRDTIYPNSLIMRDNSYLTLREYCYLSSNTKAEDCYMMLGDKKEYELIMLFKQAEIGDKLIIDNFLESFVKE